MTPPEDHRTETPQAAEAYERWRAEAAGEYPLDWDGPGWDEL